MVFRSSYGYGIEDENLKPSQEAAQQVKEDNVFQSQYGYGDIAQQPTIAPVEQPKPSQVTVEPLKAPETQPAPQVTISQPTATLNFAQDEERSFLSRVQETYDNFTKRLPALGETIKGGLGIAGQGIVDFAAQSVLGKFTEEQNKELAKSALEKKKQTLEEEINKNVNVEQNKQQISEINKQIEQGVTLQDLRAGVTTPVEKYLIDTKEEAYKEASRINQQAAAELEAQYGKPQEWSGQWIANNVAANAPSVIGSFVLGTATAVVTKNPSLALTVGFSSSFVQEAAGAYAAARDAGVDEKNANRIATNTALVSALIEQIPLGNYLFKSPAGVSFKKNALKWAYQTFLERAKEGTLEGATESLQQIVQNAFAREYEENKSLYDGVLESFVIGGILGIAGGAVGSLFVDPKTGEVDQQAANNPVLPPDETNAGIKAVDEAINTPEELRTDLQKEIAATFLPEETIQQIKSKTTQPQVQEAPTQVVNRALLNEKQTEEIEFIKAALIGNEASPEAAKEFFDSLDMPEGVTFDQINQEAQNELRQVEKEVTAEMTAQELETMQIETRLEAANQNPLIADSNVSQYVATLNKGLRVYNLNRRKGIDDIATISNKVAGFDAALEALQNAGYPVETMKDVAQIYNQYVNDKKLIATSKKQTAPIKAPTKKTAEITGKAKREEVKRRIQERARERGIAKYRVETRKDVENTKQVIKNNQIRLVSSKLFNRLSNLTDTRFAANLLKLSRILPIDEKSTDLFNRANDLITEVITPKEYISEFTNLSKYEINLLNRIEALTLEYELSLPNQLDILNDPKSTELKNKINDKMIGSKFYNVYLKQDVDSYYNLQKLLTLNPISEANLSVMERLDLIADKVAKAKETDYPAIKNEINKLFAITKLNSYAKAQTINGFVANDVQYRLSDTNEYITSSEDKYSTNLLEKNELKNKPTISQRTLLNIINQADVKQPEKELTLLLLNTTYAEQEIIDTKDFRNKFLAEIPTLNIVELGEYEYFEYSKERLDNLIDIDYEFENYLINSEFDHGIFEGSHGLQEGLKETEETIGEDIPKGMFGHFRNIVGNKTETNNTVLTVELQSDIYQKPPKYEAVINQTSTSDLEEQVAVLEERANKWRENLAQSEAKVDEVKDVVKFLQETDLDLFTVFNKQQSDNAAELTVPEYELLQKSSKALALVQAFRVEDVQLKKFFSAVVPEESTTNYKESNKDLATFLQTYIDDPDSNLYSWIKSANDYIAEAEAEIEDIEIAIDDIRSNPDRNNKYIKFFQTYKNNYYERMVKEIVFDAKAKGYSYIELLEPYDLAVYEKFVDEPEFRPYEIESRFNEDYSSNDDIELGDTIFANDTSYKVFEVDEEGFGSYKSELKPMTREAASEIVLQGALKNYNRFVKRANQSGYKLDTYQDYLNLVAIANSYFSYNTGRKQQKIADELKAKLNEDGVPIYKQKQIDDSKSELITAEKFYNTFNYEDFTTRPEYKLSNLFNINAYATRVLYTNDLFDIVQGSTKTQKENLTYVLKQKIYQEYPENVPPVNEIPQEIVDKIYKNAYPDIRESLANNIQNIKSNINYLTAEAEKQKLNEAKNIKLAENQANFKIPNEVYALYPNELKRLVEKNEYEDLWDREITDVLLRLVENKYFLSIYNTINRSDIVQEKRKNLENIEEIKKLNKSITKNQERQALINITLEKNFQTSSGDFVDNSLFEKEGDIRNLTPLEFSNLTEEEVIRQWEKSNQLITKDLALELHKVEVPEISKDSYSYDFYKDYLLVEAEIAYKTYRQEEKQLMFYDTKIDAQVPINEEEKTNILNDMYLSTILRDRDALSAADYSDYLEIQDPNDDESDPLIVLVDSYRDTFYSQHPSSYTTREDVKDFDENSRLLNNNSHRTVIKNHRKYFLPTAEKLFKKAVQRNVNSNFSEQIKTTRIDLNQIDDNEPLILFRTKRNLDKLGLTSNDKAAKQLLKMNKKIFGDDKIQIVQQIFGNKEALGAYFKNFIYLQEGKADIFDTFYHEVTHKFIDIFLTIDEQVALYEAAMRKYDTDDLNLIEEKIAEDSIAYIKDKLSATGRIKTLFEKMGERFEIYNKNKDEIEKFYDEILTPITKRQRNQAQKIQAETEAETLISTLGLKVEARAIAAGIVTEVERLPEYERMNLKDQGALAVNFLEQDPEGAVAVALGQAQPPAGIIPESVFIAVENKAIQDGDAELIRQLATSPRVSEATSLGQRIRMLGERNADSPVARITEIAEARKQAIEQARGVTLEKETAKLKKSVENEVKKIKKGDWESFIDSIQC